ncbi:hypothetical protein [Pseudomonas aeruginosa]|uniref:hypothetical protein n=1 Tax=Pseudomonas aeruginosa TaxID=287 RepID=UPI0009FA4BB3|nr:hypothetical protein [Pseudomonas aeruginosa]ORE40281.1 hypothetical protein BKN47_06460 [Pseudomonas aeruginosa]
MNDRTLLELAARAAGYKLSWSYDNHCCWINEMRHDFDVTWNPRDDDGDALRLAVRLNLDIRYESYDAGVAVIVGGAWDDAPEAVHEIFERDGPRATRRAIVRAAAEIGKSMGGGE